MNYSWSYINNTFMIKSPEYKLYIIKYLLQYFTWKVEIVFYLLKLKIVR